MAELADFHEKRFMGALKALATLLRQYHVEKWANWFEEDLADYLAAMGPPRQAARQMAVVEHVLMAFGGMSTFTRLQLADESGTALQAANERLHFLSTQLWAAARSMQGVLAAAD